MYDLSRRQFLKLSGATAVTLAVVDLGFNLDEARANSARLKTETADVSPTICPYCSVGCGILIHSKGDQVIYSEGDPDNPINRGSTCSKGASIRQLYTTDRRATTPLYRAAGSSEWEEKDWDWMLDQVALRIKETRDSTFIQRENGMPVNRTEAIANLGGAALENEECYVIQKLVRGIGIVFVEHQARVCHSSTVGGLAPSFGRGAMSNHWNDIQFADVILVMGSNPAENHPISMKYVQKAIDKGGKLLVVDPRFTRTAAKSQVYAPLRSGTDLAFCGGLMKYIFDNELYHRDYVLNYTNAPFLINEGYEFHDGLFSGFDEMSGTYNKETWTYQTDEDGNILKDERMQDPNCVLQIMKKHYERYDVETVCSITGTPKEDYLKIAEIFCGTGTAEKTGTVMYSMGSTQHTVGTQNVRSFALIQLLLGNMGRAGGGINALRGESNVQGSTDFGLLYHTLPAYMSMTNSSEEHRNLQAYIENETPAGGYWSNTPKFIVSYLKAHFGENARPENDFLYDYFPKYRAGINYSHIALFERMYDGGIKGLMSWGQNPVVGGPNASKEKNALKRLDWYMCADMFLTETATFWTKEAGSNPADIDTEVFFMPACGSFEKDGTITNSGRWMQYRWAAVDTKGKSRSDSWIAHNIMRKLQKLYADDHSEIAAPIKAVDWNFGDDEYPNMDLVAREINGYNLLTGRTVSGFDELKDDGTTNSGCWIYSGFYPDAGPEDLPGEKNLSQRRNYNDTGHENYLEWSWAWPMNRRVLYNRASADLNGRTWGGSEEKKVIEWDGNQWSGYDVPDFIVDLAPSDPGGANPFIMQTEGIGELFSDAMDDGPLTEHYEPYESPVPNGLSSVELNPLVKIWDTAENGRGTPDEFPIVGTTYRLTEQWQSGSMTRNTSYTAELLPHMCVEISEELADEKGIKVNDRITVRSIRGEIEAYAMITKRFKPYTIQGKKIHHIGMPWGYGYQGLVTGDIANILTPHIGDANTMIPEYKVFLCDIRRVES